MIRNFERWKSLRAKKKKNSGRLLPTKGAGMEWLLPNLKYGRGNLYFKRAKKKKEKEKGGEIEI